MAGGGITPDIYSKQKTDYTSSTRELLSHPDRPIFKYSGNLAEFIKKKYNSYEQFSTKYQINNTKKQKFFTWLKNEKIEFVKEELNNDWIYIENRILAEIASRNWGKKYFYKQLLKTDEQAQEALKHFGEAYKIFNN